MSCSPTPQRVSGSDLAIKFVEGPDIKASEDLTFLVINMSTACIEFPDDFGIKIYYLDKNDAWVETNNWELICIHKTINLNLTETPWI